MYSARIQKRGHAIVDPGDDVENDKDISWVVDKRIKESEEPSKSLFVASSKPKARQDTLVEKSLGEFVSFCKQREALAALDVSKTAFKDARVFSYEICDADDDNSFTGARSYILTTLDRFWAFYSDREASHMYELILENTPCRLYFDLEYSKESNPDADATKLLDHFFSCFTYILDDMFLINSTKENFVLLDSSTAVKFSCHAICHLPGDLLFPSNVAMRPFIQSLQKELLRDSPFRLMNSERTKEISLVDCAVYSRNRNFRLFMSSKLGKDTPLKLASYCTFYGKRQPTNKQIFFDSLCIPKDCYRFELLAVDGYSLPAKTVTRQDGVTPPKTMNKDGMCTGESPFRDLDDFMLNMIFKKRKSSSYIRQWKLIEEQGKSIGIIYYPANCRYCFNIGREHKSNGTYWTVDFKTRSFHQKCFDPDCKGTSSNFFPLPKFITSFDKHAKESDDDEEEDPENELEKRRFFYEWETLFEQ